MKMSQTLSINIMHGLICYAQSDLQKFKGLLIKIKVFQPN